MKDKLIFLDTETTGLDEKDKDGLTLLASEIHSIIEFAAIVDIDGKIAGHTTITAQPRDDDEPDPKSLEINGVDPKDFASRRTQEQLFAGLKEFLDQFVDRYDKEDKLWIVAYNADFDVRFLRSLWNAHDDPYFNSYFWVPAVDIMQIVAYSILGEGVRHTFPNFKLSTVAEQLGIKVNKKNIHGALYDVRLCRQIFYKLNS